MKTSMVFIEKSKPLIVFTFTILYTKILKTGRNIIRGALAGPVDTALSIGALVYILQYVHAPIWGNFFNHYLDGHAG